METAIKDAKTMFTLGEISEILGSVMEGDPESRLTPLMGIEIDGRRTRTGYLFVAVAGEKRDGHDYVEQAFSNGAAAAVVSREQAARRRWLGSRYIEADDTVFALGELARSFRRKFDLKVVAVTGSNGKTTVKNLIYEIMSIEGPALKSAMNFNNFFGLPLSIFKITDSHKAAVFELGMSAAGEISRLSRIASPDIAVITNVGPAHLEFFENVERIADAKLEITDGMRADGALIINGDDRLLRRKIDRHIETVTFGLDGKNDVYPRELEFDDQQRPSFKINGVKFRMNLPGVHNLYNALAAIAVAEKLGIDTRKYADTLRDYVSTDMRTQIVARAGITYMIDCYNANPVSMKYALDTLAGMNCAGRRIAVLGDMLELGPRSREYHLETGEYAREKGIDGLFCCGEFSAGIARGFGENAIFMNSKSELADRLREFLRSGDLVLFKASRGMAMEEIVKNLLGSV